VVSDSVELSTIHVYFSGVVLVVLTTQNKVVFVPALRTVSPFTRTDNGAVVAIR